MNLIQKLKSEYAYHLFPKYYIMWKILKFSAGAKGVGRRGKMKG